MRVVIGCTTKHKISPTFFFFWYALGLRSSKYGIFWYTVNNLARPLLHCTNGNPLTNFQKIDLKLLLLTGVSLRPEIGICRESCILIVNPFLLSSFLLSGFLLSGARKRCKESTCTVVAWKQGEHFWPKRKEILRWTENIKTVSHAYVQSAMVCLLKFKCWDVYYILSQSHFMILPLLCLLGSIKS